MKGNKRAAALRIGMAIGLAAVAVTAKAQVTIASPGQV